MSKTTPARSGALTRRRLLTLAAGSGVALLAGCALPGMTPVTYDLAATPTSGSGRRLGRTVLITEPEAIQTYDTQRIVVREPGGVLSYLGQSQWSDVLPRLVQTRLLQSFQDRGITNVGRVSDRIEPDLLLTTDIRAFEIDASTAPATAAVSITVRLVDDWNRRVLATETFSANVALAEITPALAIPALNAALAEVTDGIIGWTAGRA
ncbi:ABC-type transport auxiliary lipoprotein family protein [Pelagibacterium montanilacus]|uniref:ABC-type transport auxiliary lipoprotein family protein n=1 Tax=Pelagibacterium montanilacus TaxID=2185280 RepID=UPI000F8C6E5D|nr:ABC-type transport auxiliary lipoprotein family protein [Pelagibacterium montanilacus]